MANQTNILDDASTWKLIDSYFRDNPQALVGHHIDSYNDFFKTSIYQIFKEKNPLRLYSRFDPETNEYRSQCNLYMGGRNGDKLYFGKPIINDTDNTHYMFPNEARLRNMTYGMTIHYDIEVEFIDRLKPGEAPTVIGHDLQKEIEGGGVFLDPDHYTEADYAEGKHDENYKLSKMDVLSEGPSLAEQEGGQGEQKREQQEGGAPKAVLIKAKTSTSKKGEPKKVVLTTAASARIREATEQSMQALAKADNMTKETGKGTETPSSFLIQRRTEILSKIYLGKFPIMVQSDFCILQGLPREARHSMGECRNDLGGYFIIDGKEKTVVSQEKFADNMLYVRALPGDEHYSHSADIRSVSENVSKPIRTFSVKICAPTSRYRNGNIVVNIPNVRKPVPLFIVFRALGILSDKSIIEHCLLDMDKYDTMVDLFIPSVHDSATILTQQNALQYIALLTKGKTTVHALEILADYFLPHVGEVNYTVKAYALGQIAFRLLSVSTGLEVATDRDNFKYKRIELVGSLLYDLFREYWNIQLKQVHLEFEKRLYYNQDRYENNLFGLILDNYRDVFKERSLETGFRKAFKGNWGAYTHTKRIGLIQDLNRLSFNSALDHLRKTNLPLDSGVKLVGPRVLHNSQWGLLDPIDTPDGGSIGLHKHLAIFTYVTRGASREPMIAWIREKWSMKLVEEFSPRQLSAMTKVIVNGCWVGVVQDPIACIEKFRLFRRNALIPIYASATFDIGRMTIYVYTDAGRLCRPIFYRDELNDKPSYLANRQIMDHLKTGEFTWTDLVSGFNKKRNGVKFDMTQMKIYELFELYEGVETETNPAKLERFLANKAILDYIDASESENALIAMNMDVFDQGTSNSSRYTHCEIHNSLILGMMCNMIIFPENNPATRNSFSCGQSKQACSLYHTNYHVRMDKSAIVLNYGQTPLLKSRFLEHITHEENSYGENAIVAIACYTGYNVEDAMLINEGAIKRGLFRTSYFTCYEAHEETTQNINTSIDKRFINVEAEPAVLGTKPGYDYSKLDEFGIIREGTQVDDKTVLIGLASVGTSSSGSAVGQMTYYTDESKTPKKGQLGIVDRVFITDGEAGQRIAKVRILEQRTPTLGDKMASRAGQKGTIGMVVPERDMPFTAEGIRPDIIINPHALPSRMTVGQLVECITGKACAMMGGFGDCTAFNNRGSKIGMFGELLGKNGYHSSGNELLYNGMTGEQLEAEIFMGPTYYMRLKHMVKDKINYRALGPRTALTKQPVGGRANDGGLRIGEMERDTLISHGMADFLRESMMERGDKSFVAICNNTGLISIYNPAKGLLISPMADGPLQYTGSLESDDLRIQHITKYGRSFSVVCIPYSMKLMMQELTTIGMQMRIVTEDNIKQIESMSYSDNLDRLLKKKDVKPKSLIDAIKRSLAEKGHGINLVSPTDTHVSLTPSSPFETPPYIPTSPAYRSSLEDSLDDDVLSERGQNSTPPYVATSPAYVPTSPAYVPTSPAYNPGSPVYDPTGSVSPQYIPRGDDDEEDRSASPEYKVGGTVYMKGVDDGYADRPWTIRHIGDKFMTVDAKDNRGLSPDKCVRVVSALDIFPHDQLIHARQNAPATMMYPQSSLNQIDLGEMPYSMPPPSQPPTVINFAPTLVNGSGHSVTSASPMPMDPMGSILPNPFVSSQSHHQAKEAIEKSIEKSGTIEDMMQKGQALIIKKSS